jgi:hypothetical protein
VDAPLRHFLPADGGLIVETLRNFARLLLAPLGLEGGSFAPFCLLFPQKKDKVWVFTLGQQFGCFLLAAGFLLRLTLAASKGTTAVALCHVINRALERLERAQLPLGLGFLLCGEISGALLLQCQGYLRCSHGLALSCSGHGRLALAALVELREHRGDGHLPPDRLSGPLGTQDPFLPLSHLAHDLIGPAALCRLGVELLRGSGDWWLGRHMCA